MLSILLYLWMLFKRDEKPKEKAKKSSGQNREEEHKKAYLPPSPVEIVKKEEHKEKVDDKKTQPSAEIVKKQEQKGKVDDKKPQASAEIAKNQQQKGKVGNEIVEDREKDVIVLDDIRPEDSKKHVDKVETKAKDLPTEVVKPKEKEVLPPKDEKAKANTEESNKKEKAKVEGAKVTPKDPKETVERKDVLYHITVKTGEKFNAGTDANVFICLIGEQNDTGKVVLRAQDSDNNKLFEKGAEDRFIVRAVDVGEVKRIRIGHDNKDGFAGWFLDWVTVQAQDHHLVFKAGRWLDEDEGDKKLEVELTPEKVVQSAQKRIYSIIVKTGDIKYGGTDAKVFIYLTGQQGTTNKIFLKHSKTHKDPFEGNQVDHFIVEEMNVGDISKIRIGHDGKRSGAGWFLDNVMIEATGFDHKWSFTANRWLDKKEGDGHLAVDLNAVKVKL